MYVKERTKNSGFKARMRTPNRAVEASRTGFPQQAVQRQQSSQGDGQRRQPKRSVRESERQTEQHSPVNLRKRFGAVHGESLRLPVARTDFTEYAHCPSSLRITSPIGLTMAASAAHPDAIATTASRSGTLRLLSLQCICHHLPADPAKASKSSLAQQSHNRQQAHDGFIRRKNNLADYPSLGCRRTMLSPLL